jgi:putative transposase
VNGRQRHLVVDTLGRRLAVVVPAASVQDRDGATLVLATRVGRFPRLELLWADGGYAGQVVAWVTTLLAWTLAIVKRTDALRGFPVLPKRWIVERTFGWLGRYRRLSTDDEELTASSEAMLYLAMTQLRLRRLRPT